MAENNIPLVPADCDLRDFPFMPLDVVRLRDSDIAALTSGDEFRAAIMLWCAAWHQVPAASIPDDDIVLARLAGYGRVVKEWQKVRENALRGWVKCSDGRLYHPVVAEKARDAWKAKLEQRWKTECARIKKHNDRHEGANVPRPSFDQWMSAGCPQGQPLPVPRDKCERPQFVPRETHSKGQGQGQYVNPSAQSTSTTQPLSRDETAAVVDSAAPDPIPADPINARAVELALLLRQRGAALQPSDPRVRQWAQSGVSDAKALAALETAQQQRHDSGSHQPISAGYLDAILSDVGNRSPPGGKRSGRQSRIDNYAAQAAAARGYSPHDDRATGSTIDGHAQRIA